MAQTLNISPDTAQRIADMVVGCRVDRAAAVTTGGVEVLFTVSGGNILLTGFYGEIMVAIDAAATLAINYDADNKLGLALEDTALGSVSANPNTYVAGRMVYLPIEGGAMTFTAAGGACPIDVAPIMVLPPGHFDLTSGAATTLGTIRWSLWYIPLEAGAKVVSN